MQNVKAPHSITFMEESFLSSSPHITVSAATILKLRENRVSSLCSAWLVSKVSRSFNILLWGLCCHTSTTRLVYIQELVIFFSIVVYHEKPIYLTAVALAGINVTNIYFFIINKNPSCSLGLLWNSNLYKVHSSINNKFYESVGLLDHLVFCIWCILLLYIAILCTT